MIRVRHEYDNTDGNILLSIKGHANYAPKGKDILCAYVSGMYEMMLLGLELYGDDLVTVNHDEIYLKYEMSDDYVVCESQINCFVLAMKQLEAQYPKYIKVKEL